MPMPFSRILHPFDYLNRSSGRHFDRILQRYITTENISLPRLPFSGVCFGGVVVVVRLGQDLIPLFFAAPGTISVCISFCILTRVGNTGLYCSILGRYLPCIFWSLPHSGISDYSKSFSDARLLETVVEDCQQLLMYPPERPFFFLCSQLLIEVGAIWLYLTPQRRICCM